MRRAQRPGSRPWLASMRRRSSICQLAIAKAPGPPCRPPGATPLAPVELGDVKGHVGRRAEHLLETARPAAVLLDHRVVAGHAHRPARATAGQVCEQSSALGGDVHCAQQTLDLRHRDRVEEHAAAARDDCGQDHERVQARGREDDHAVRVRLLESLQEHALVLVAEAADVGDDRHPSRAHSRLQVEERL